MISRNEKRQFELKQKFSPEECNDICTAILKNNDIPLNAVIKSNKQSNFKIINGEKVFIPRSVKEAESTSQWPQWLEAIEKEMNGMKDNEVYEEVLKSSMPDGVSALPLMWVFNVKNDGTFKARLVVRGDLSIEGIHYLENASCMASMESIRMLIAFAAANNHKLFTIDFSQAYTNDDELNPHMYCQLPELPIELQNSSFGLGRCKSHVAHMKRNLYGEKQAGRIWLQFLLNFLRDELKAKIFISDRNVFEWTWNDQILRAVIHVDDVLFSVSNDEIKNEFLKRLKSKFLITGGEEEATNFIGLQIERNWKKEDN